MSKELKRNWIEDLNGWNGFTYVTLMGVPMKRSKDGGVVDYQNDRIAKLVAHCILQNPVPLTGHELSLLRSVTKLSYNKFAQKLGLSYGAIFNWEKNKSKRLLPWQEVVVRILCAEELNIVTSSKFSELIGFENFDNLEVRVTNKSPTPKYIKTKTIYKPSYRGYRKVQVTDEEYFEDSKSKKRVHGFF